jgi:hypothetical protein
VHFALASKNTCLCFMSAIFYYKFVLSSHSNKNKAMSLQQDIMVALKEAMKAKDQTALTALRAVKSAILLAQTESGAKEELTEEQELKILQKQVKQRKDSAAIYLEQGREDLAAPELAEAEVIGQFLPTALSDEDVEKVVVNIINEVGAQGMKDMGKVMGLVSKELAGQADGKTISNIVKAKLS